MGKHTTYARNLDKIVLHKSGDSFGFHVNTNLEGKHMMKHEANSPFGNIFKRTSFNGKAKGTDVYSVFCYPSSNRPFYGRQDNFDLTGPVTGNKDIGSLTHHFLTMPPIKKGDGTLIKQRCSFILEQTMSMTFHFPETVTEDEAENLTHQKDAIILRPAIVKIKQPKTGNTPTPPSAWNDWVREALREAIQLKGFLDFPVSPTQINWIANYLGNRVPNADPNWKPIARIGQICGIYGFEPACSNVDNILKEIRGNLPAQIDWGGSIPIGAPQAGTPPPPIEDVEEIAGKILPKIEPTYAPKFKPLTTKEYEEMIVNGDIGNRKAALFGTLFWNFCWYLVDNGLHEIPHPSYDHRVPDSVLNMSGLKQSAEIGKLLVEWGQSTLDAMYNNQCSAVIVRIFPEKVSMGCWNRDYIGAPNWDTVYTCNLKSLLPSSGAPLDFSLQTWYEWLYWVGITPMPSYLALNKLQTMYNKCIKDALEKQYPRLPLTEEQIKKAQDNGLIPKDVVPAPQKLEPITPVDPDWMQYKTSVFFV